MVNLREWIAFFPPQLRLLLLRTWAMPLSLRCLYCNLFFKYYLLGDWKKQKLLLKDCYFARKLTVTHFVDVCRRSDPQHTWRIAHNICYDARYDEPLFPRISVLREFVVISQASTSLLNGTIYFKSIQYSPLKRRVLISGSRRPLWGNSKIASDCILRRTWYATGSVNPLSPHIM